MQLVNMWLWWSWVDPESNMTGVHIKRENLHRGRSLWKYWSSASISYATTNIAGKPLKGRREAWNRFSLTAFRKNQPHQKPDLGL